MEDGIARRGGTGAATVLPVAMTAAATGAGAEAAAWVEDGIAGRGEAGATRAMPAGAGEPERRGELTAGAIAPMSTVGRARSTCSGVA